MCFYNDLIKGEHYETLSLERILNYYNLLGLDIKLLNVNKNYEYDFQLTNNFKYEVKYCGDASKYVFIEFYSWGRAAGITTTQSDYYIIVLPKKEYLLLQTTKLKHLCEYQEYKKRYEDKTKKGYLFDIEHLKDNGILI